MVPIKLLLTLISGLWACGGAHRDEPFAGTVTHASKAQVEGREALAGSYIVAFRPPSMARELLRFSSFASEYKTHFSLLQDRFLADSRVKSLDFLTALDLSPAAKAPQDFGVPLRFAFTLDTAGPTVSSIARVDFTDQIAAAAALGEWDQSGALYYAEPNYISHTSQAEPENLFKDIAADYAALDWWWLKKINLPQALEAIANRDLNAAGTPTDAEMTGNAPIVAVMDSGVDFEHPALKDHIWENTDVNAANCDNDRYGCNTTAAERGKLGNGDVFPFDTQGPGEACASFESNCSHGTHVAGLIAADRTWKDQTGRSVGGTCPICKIMIVKIVSKIGNDSGILDSSIIAGFKYVALFDRSGSSAVRVVNASFGKFVRSRTVGLMIRLMREKRGALVIAAAGNEDTLTMEYPAAFGDAIAVSAVDSKLRKVSFSNFGRWVDIAAPGQSLLSTVPGAQLAEKSGTSMASPVVAGVAGLLLARYPKLSYDALRTLLLTSSDPTFYGREFENGFNYSNYYPIIPSESTRQPLLGVGVLNAAGAVAQTASSGLPLFSDLDRVKAGCSAIGAATPPSAGALSLVVLLAPIGLSLVGRRRRPH